MRRAAVPPPVATRAPARPAPEQLEPHHPEEPTAVDEAPDEAAEDVAPDHEAPPPSRPQRGWRVVSVAGELVVTAGLVVLLFVVYELFITDLFTAHEQSRLEQQLHDTWSASPQAEVEPPVGRPMAVLHIPRLGSDFERVVVEGTDQDQLAQGPGHYVGSAMPGQQGNLALAGHRVGKGSPFLDLDTMRPGDAIVVETATQWYVYRVLGDPATGDVTTDPSGIVGTEVVDPTAIDVISATPDGPATAPPSGAYLTLTTCNPKYSARTRLVVHARLDGDPVSKASAPAGPPALTGR
jgi:sortase A